MQGQFVNFIMHGCPVLWGMGLDVSGTGARRLLGPGAPLLALAPHCGIPINVNGTAEAMDFPPVDQTATSRDDWSRDLGLWGA